MSKIFDLGKLRFQFQGVWNPLTTYEYNDVVKFGGNVYVYVNNTKSTGNLPTVENFWSLMVEGFKFEGVYDPTVTYPVGDGVSYGGRVFIAKVSTKGNTPTDTTYWSTFVDGLQYEGEFSNVTKYQKNDIVTYGGKSYIAKQDCVGSLPTATLNWDIFSEGLNFVGSYNNSTSYLPGDTVTYGSNAYVAKVETLGNTPTNTPYWDILVNGSKFIGIYDKNVSYFPNDIVTYGGNVYISSAAQTNVLPTTNSWKLLVIGFSFVGHWTNNVNYLIGQVVSFGGSSYQAIYDNFNSPPNTLAGWTKIVSGFKFRGDWVTNTLFETEDLVVRGSNSYIAIKTHTSTDFEADLTANNWQKLTSGIRWAGTWAAGVNYFRNDIVKSGTSTYIVLADYTSGQTFATDFANNKLTEFAQGGSYVLPAASATSIEKPFLSSDGINYVYASARENIGAFNLNFTGFLSNLNNSISFNNSNRTFTLTPTGILTIYYRGKPITISSALSVVISNVSGNHYIKFDPTVNTLIDSSTLDIDADLTIAYIYWDAVNSTALIVGDERHLARRDLAWHKYQHTTKGLSWKSGGAITYTQNSSVSTILSIAAPLVIADEDLDFNIVEGSVNGLFQQPLLSASLPVVYLSGTSYVQTTPTTLPWLSGVNRAQYNAVVSGSGSKVEVNSGQFISYWIVATNDIYNPIKLIMGRGAYNLSDDVAKLDTISSYNLPFLEFVPLYQVILQVLDTNTGNPAKVSIANIRTIRESVSPRNITNALSHQDLSDKSVVNQHPISAITSLDFKNRSNAAISLASEAAGSRGMISIQTAAFTAISGYCFCCDTTSGKFNVTLPATPVSGDFFTISDVAGLFATKPVTLLSGGQKLMGTTNDLQLNTVNANVTFVYINSTYGWRLM